jgi:hypothetical protein
LAGFVSSDKKYLNKLLMGVRVVKDDLTLVEEMKLRGATVLLVSPLYSDKFRAKTDLVDKLIEAHIHIHTQYLPSFAVAISPKIMRFSIQRIILTRLIF